MPHVVHVVRPVSKALHPHTARLGVKRKLLQAHGTRELGDEVPEEIKKPTGVSGCPQGPAFWCRFPLKFSQIPMSETFFLKYDKTRKSQTMPNI